MISQSVGAETVWTRKETAVIFVIVVTVLTVGSQCLSRYAFTLQGLC
jgi:hypothetical protein